FFVIDISSKPSKPSWNKLADSQMLVAHQVPQERTINAIVDSTGSIYVFGKFIQKSSPQPQTTTSQTQLSNIRSGEVEETFSEKNVSVKTHEKSIPIQSKQTFKSKALQQRASSSQQPISEMLKYNINTKNWTTVNIKVNDQSKLPASGFTATYLERFNSIIYIGGKSSDGNFIPMNQIWIYNISDGTLTPKNTDETIIVGRYGHSACLVENKIIVYGGLSTPPLDSSNALVILEINDGNYNWKTPNVTSNKPIAIPYYHTATIINNDTYMIVAF
ncbi:13083_t:CDS:2, partial [Ambispora gerdemannii]